ncbi:MAG: hypothetical protein Q7U74_06650, partial [Saprospiraceae bacterium]|nr:hypothetical protein [Saprospiraceae bacterium]
MISNLHPAQSKTTPQVPGASSSQAVSPAFLPPPINRIEDTGLSPLWLQDLILKVMYFQGFLTGFRIAEVITLPYNGVVDRILEDLKKDKSIEVRGSQMGLGEGAYQYAMTG